MEKLQTIGENGLQPNKVLNDSGALAKLGVFSELATYLASEGRDMSGLDIRPGDPVTGECARIVTMTTNGESVNYVNGKCNVTVSKGQECSMVAKLGRIGVESCDPCAFVNDYIVRNTGDYTGGIYRAGDSVSDTNRQALNYAYAFIVNKSIILGDPAITNTVIASMSSLSTIYTPANGVNVFSAAGMGIARAVEMGIHQSMQKGREYENGVLLMHPMVYLRALEESRNSYLGANNGIYNPYNNGFSLPQLSLYGFRVITDTHIPVVNGLSSVFFIPKGKVGLKMLLNAPEEIVSEKYNSVAPCDAQCVALRNYGAVVAKDPCSLWVATDIEIAGGAGSLRFGGYNPVNPAFVC